MPNNNAINYQTTQYNLLVGAANNNIANVSPGAEGLLRSNGAAATPVFSTSANIDFTFSASNNGTSTTVDVVNTSNAANSAAQEVLSVAGSTADDPFKTYTVTGATSFSVGIDNSDVDKFKVSASSTLGTTDTFVIFATGEILQPLQACFLAAKSAVSTNVTGDGTAYIVNYDFEIFDQNNNFNTATFTFTAPITGMYSFSNNTHCANLGVAFTTSTYNLVTTNRTYTCYNFNIGAVRTNSNDCNNPGQILADMDAGDTAFVEITVSGGTKIVGLRYPSSTFRENFSSGALEV